MILFELGFAERVVAQAVGEAIWNTCDTVDEVRILLPLFEDEIRETLRGYPSFFADVFNDILAKGTR